MVKFGQVDGEVVSCSFCGKSQKEVKKLVAGPGVYVCDECISLCNDILVEEGHLSTLPATADAVALPRAELTAVVRVLDQAVGAIGMANAAVADEASRLAGRLHRRLQQVPAAAADEPDPDPT